MKRLLFYIARTFRREGPLRDFSVTKSELLGGLSGKSVAIVGNARALSLTRYGAEIDAHDIVIRINRAPMPEAHSHGRKIDWLGAAVRVKPHLKARILWMSPKRKRLDYASAKSDGFYLHPQSEYARLKAKFNTPPTTGIMLIDLIAQSEASKIDLYGFDFFSSLSLTGRRTAEQVPHDFGTEQEFVTSLVLRDPRITLHQM